MSDLLLASVPVVNATAEGTFPGVRVACGQPSLFSARVDLKGNNGRLYDRFGKEILGGSAGGAGATPHTMRYTLGGSGPMADGKVQFINASNAPCLPSESPTAMRISKKDADGKLDLRLLRYVATMRMAVRHLNGDDTGNDALCFFRLASNGVDNGSFFQFAIHAVLNMPQSVWRSNDVLVVEAYAVSFLTELADVNGMIFPSDGQALVWSEANQDWRPGTVSGGGGGGGGSAPAKRYHQISNFKFDVLTPNAFTYVAPSPGVTVPLASSDASSSGGDFRLSSSTAAPPTGSAFTLAPSTDVPAAERRVFTVSNVPVDAVAGTMRLTIDVALYGVTATGWPAGYGRVLVNVVKNGGAEVVGRHSHLFLFPGDFAPAITFSTPVLSSDIADGDYFGVDLQVDDPSLIPTQISIESATVTARCEFATTSAV